MGLKLDASSLEKGLARFEDKADLALRMYAETAAVKLEGQMKKRAVWTDRSSRARTSLKGNVEVKSGGYRIRLSQGVDYGAWLELAHEKKYAIIAPTINTMSPEVMAGLKALIDRMK